MKEQIFLKDKLVQFLKSNTSKKIAIIVNSHDKLAVIAPVLRQILNDNKLDVGIVCFKSRVPEEFKLFEDKVKISEDYLSREDYFNIDTYVFDELSKDWDREAKVKFKDAFVSHDIELSRIVEYDLQLFLLARIKALAIIDRVIKKENYTAVFIIDTNGELLLFDKLFTKNYGIPFKLVEIRVRKDVGSIIKSIFVSFLQNSIDFAAGCFIFRKKQIKLIDARLYYYSDLKNQRDFVLAPFEAGLKLRIKCFLKNSGYVPFKLNSRRFAFFNFSSRVCSDFNINCIKKHFIFENIDYWEIVENKIMDILKNDFKRIRQNITTFVNFAKRYEINNVILRNDVKELEKTIVFAAKNFDISTLVIQHGLLIEPNGNNYLFADKIAAWGNFTADWYGQFGNDIKKIIMTGSLNSDKIFDWLRHSKDDNCKVFLEEIGLNKRQRVVSLFTTGISMLKLSSFTTDDMTENLIRDVLRAVKSIGGLNLIIKLHPNEDLKNFERVVKNEDKTCITMLAKTDLYRLIQISDLVVTIDSTVALEALMIGKPLVAINLSKRPYLAPYIERNVALGAFSKDQIENTIELALYNEDVKRKMQMARESFLDYVIYKFDGNAKNRITNLIEN